jgi:N-acetylglucosaminyldiphosphoundecaprenol N-acetyl-beta-D-mannosaminyltransferase
MPGETTPLREKRTEVFGVPLDLLTMSETIQRCSELIEARRPIQHVVLNAGKVVLMNDDPRLRSVIAGCDLVNADGQSIVWAGRFLGIPVPERVAGIDLMEALLGLAAERGWPVYLLGARQDVLETFVARVRDRWPNVIIAGYRNGYFEDDAEVARDIARSGARLLFVAISSPRKEFFLAEQREELGEVFAMGVGGSFDVWAGLTRRAPVWMQRCGLEWFYRLMQEPGRMGKRYLVGNARFIVLTIGERIRRRSAR